MKKAILVLAITFAGTFLFAQKKENGTIYIDHPAIKVIDEFEKASVAGDSVKIAGFLTEDFKSYNGTTTRLSNLSETATGKAAYVNTTLLYGRELDYFAIEPVPGSYPDVLDYKKDNKNGDIVILNWIVIKGVHKTTGVKIDAAAQRIYYLTKDNKIKRIISYSNGKVIDEIYASFANRTNGKIYNHHENVNTIRKAVYAFEKGDIEKYLGYYSDNVEFYDINGEWGKTRTKAQEKENIQQFLSNFEIKSIDMIGYPDYLEYEMDNGREVLSWWKFNLVRKSDKKAIALPMHLSNSFDEKGNIVAEIAYYSEALLTK
ncbi:MAG: hypothetical protein KIT80_03970 [Chitinophagaceae bacterium]|nr:hypothetical protein [Chitinophagaceae bacterium]MCW5926046.1 hypothetical protein [Chitinophagaceae bacterium]